jgi:hypothetical protein
MPPTLTREIDGAVGVNAEDGVGIVHHIAIERGAAGRGSKWL